MRSGRRVDRRDPCCTRGLREGPPRLSSRLSTRSKRVVLDGNIERARRETGQIDLRQGIVEKRQHGLEDRRARQVSLRNHVLDQLLERDVLMRVGLEGALSDTTQHLLERRVARKVDPQRQRVHEEPDQPFELALIAVRDRESHDDVVLSAVPRQQDLECGHERHEQRGPLALAR